MIVVGTKVKLAIAALGVLAVGYSGWMARGWFEDSKDLAAMEAQQALAAELRDGIGQVSAQVEDRLSQLKANETVIDRGVIREIQRPVYQRVCLEPDAISLLNAAARGEAPGKLTEEVSEALGATD